MAFGQAEANKKWNEIRLYLEGRRDDIEATAARGISYDRVVGDLKSYLYTKSGLRTFEAATVVSIGKEAIEIARAGLRLGVNDEAYLSCYKDQATKIPGYQGLIKLAMQSGMIEHISAAVVHENDEFDYSLGTDSFIKHKMPPKLGKRGNIIGAYVIAKMKDGKEPFIDLMNMDEIQAVKEKARAHTSSPWNDKQAFPGMCKKTVTRRGLKYLPKNAEAQDFLRNEDLEEPIDEAVDEPPPDEAVAAEPAAPKPTKLAKRAAASASKTTAPAPAPTTTATAAAATNGTTAPPLEAPSDATSGDEPPADEQQSDPF